MSAHYVTILPAPGRPWEMACVENGNVRLCRSGDGAGPRDLCTVIVPGTDVILHRIRLSAGRQADRLRAARFSLEDEMSAPVETLHAACAAQAGADGLTDTCAVSASRMKDWIAELQTAGLPRARLIPDVSLLADTGAVDLGTHILAQIAGRPVAIDASLPLELRSALSGLIAAPPVKVGEPLLWLAGQVAAGHTGIDLRQGVFAQKQETGANMARLRLSGILAACLGIACLTQTMLGTHYTNRLSDGLQDEARKIYAAAFPGQPVPANLPAALRDQAGTPSASSASFRDMSAVLYSALADASQVRLTSLRYDGDLGELRASLVYPAFGDDQNLKTGLEARGLVARLGDTRYESGRVVGDLILEMPR